MTFHRLHKRSGAYAMTTDVENPIAIGPGRDWSGARSIMRGALTAFVSRLEKRGTRIDLAELSDTQLLDIGVTRSEARAEIKKSWFWG
ncbi:DUF1127 domain-containing protein [Rhizobium sp. RCC_161_2]|uniref:DUF1127 domain-containing protein n=1 Tax=Rhizobium sp. RCC_161_2 TaxID=3239219 RepID=UPI003524683C